MSTFKSAAAGLRCSPATAAQRTAIFVHGFLGTPGDWEPIAAPLGASLQVAALALPGHADAPCEPAKLPHDFVQASNVLLKWLRGALPDVFAENASKPALVGYSMGGRIALHWALRHPELFSCVVVESAAPGIASEQARAARKEHDHALAVELEQMHTPEAFRGFLEGWYARPPFDMLTAEQHAALVEKRLANRPRGVAAALRAYSVGAQPDFWPELEALQLPALVLCGENDHKYRQIAEEMAARSPRVAIHVMGDCGHNVHFEQPAAYTTVLRGFLEGVL